MGYYYLQQQGLERVDVFGQIVFLRMNKQAYFRTKIGGTISLAVLFLMIYFYSQSLRSFFLKEQLRVISANQYEDEVQSIQLDQSDFMFAFKIEQNNFTTSPFFNLTLEQKQIDENDIQENIKDYQMANKTKYQPSYLWCLVQVRDFNPLSLDMGLILQRISIVLELVIFYVPSKMYNKYTRYNNTIFVGGTYTSSDFQFLTLTISHCESNEQISCASKETVDQYFSSTGSFKLQIYTINQIINPYKQRYGSAFLDDQIYFTFVPNQLNRKANIYFRKYEFINDESLLPFRYQSQLSSDIQEDTVFLIDQSDIKEMSDIGTTLDASYATFNFRLNPFKTKFTRSFQKIDELLSNLGGIQQIFFFFIGLLVGIYNRIQFLVELANKLFEFQLDSSIQNRQYQENLELIDEFIQHRENHLHVNSNAEIDEIDNQQVEDKLSPDISQRYNLLNLFLNTGGMVQKPTNQTKSSKETSKQHYILAEKLKFISGLDYFQKQIIKIIERQKPIFLDFQILCNYISCGKLFKNQPKVILMNKAFDNIIDQLDVHHILLKLNELEKLKETILNYKQLMMFNFTPKPLINLDSITKEPSRQLIEQIVKSPEAMDKTDSDTIEMINYKKMSRNQPNLFGDYLIYSKIFNAYDDILQSSDTVYSNKALIQKLGPELQIVFKLSKLIDIQHKIYHKQKHPTRRGAVQQEEEDLCVKMFDQQSQQN
ncbi:unnamed protein product (macronuclear) [Paramecium tetraurelia]|uniref:Transmembrane protein n=1 Tax=Paramecium tetraurelia TaxID=5888 RepID=A0EBM4_PARTE|nr:uncharacterized protein GSPATT00025425001 [Paramecium tetraurelia]CAK92691.1 unnamed protein product [Paramecium tetraurelia]|eukprot:XP_001460088.1 hypothetical protein (macronuclear) [Paramecium tetraurelia strain d4-2]